MAHPNHALSMAERLDLNTSPEPNTGCWLWVGGGMTRTQGYGKLKRAGRPENVLAHRLSWEIHRGPIPPGLLVLHHCDNRLCTNPAHLFLGTDADNAKDRDSKGRAAKGDRAGRAKLTRVQAECLRVTYATGVFSVRQLGKWWGIASSGVSNIVAGKYWGPWP